MKAEGGARLAVDGITAGYGSITVLRDVSLTVKPGEVVALLGANGAGKTTTLLALSGLIAVSSGEIRLDGAPMSKVPAHRRARAGLLLVPEGRSVFQTLSVDENLRLARKRGFDPYAEFPELGRISSRRAGSLSGGEQQMVSLARALIAEPQVLLIDELSLGLAPLIVDRLIMMLKRAVRELGVSVLLVEQYLAQALKIADRAYVIQDGRIVLEDAAESLARDRSAIESTYLGVVGTA
jgi:branched-chain amino acid transport system ATP-binding protein